MSDSARGIAPVVLRPTVAEIDLDALRDNLAAIRAAVGSAQIMGVVKANAYGHGLVPTARAMLRLGADRLGVAFLQEAIVLRRAGIAAPILVLGGLSGQHLPYFLDWDIELCASSVFKLQQIDQAAGERGGRARVHLKLDTGMGRIGVRWDRSEALFAAALETRHCELAGVFSHFANSGAADTTFCRLQFDRFMAALEFFPRHGVPCPPRHIANSGAVLQHQDTCLDIVRPGILAYGIYPEPDVPRTIAVRPVLTLRTTVVYFKVVDAGWSVGYDATWQAPRRTNVVTLPVGYGDGYPRAMSNCGRVLVGGRSYPVVGRVSMDQTMVDLGEDSAYNGDDAVLIGRQGDAVIAIEEVAELARTIPYEILTGLNTRVPRRYLEGGRVVAEVRSGDDDAVVG